MNQPVIPLFLTRRVSDHSQLSEWPSVPFRRRTWATAPRPTRGGGSGPERPAEAPPTPDDSASSRSGAVWAVVITGLALFMASLDNLVVSTALPVIRVHLHAGLSGLEWTVNAYTLTFAVLLLSAAAMGERFGRRRHHQVVQ